MNLFFIALVILSSSYAIAKHYEVGTKIDFNDTPCPEIDSLAKEILPLIKDNKWFFDSELLLTAQKKNMRMLEFPVKWVDNLDSRVRIVATVKDYLLNIFWVRFKNN